MLKKLLVRVQRMGINPLHTYQFIKELPSFYKDLQELKRQRADNTDFTTLSFDPIAGEKHATTGTMSGHYFHQDLLIARKVFKNNPPKHVDIGSRTDGFVAHVAVFREIELFDIRPSDSTVKNIRFKQADLIQFPAELEDYTDSLSSLHAIEHFGLGRYGDPIDYYGHVKALKNISRIIRKGGVFYFSTPIGPQRIEFNAHRVFSISYLLELLSPSFSVKAFHFVDDKGDIQEDVELTDEIIQTNAGCHFGCGIFELIKK